VEHGENLGQLQLSTIHQNRVAFKVWRQFIIQSLATVYAKTVEKNTIEPL
jgi:hypothetical protein